MYAARAAYFLREPARDSLIMCSMIGARMISMAKPILPPGTTMVLRRDMNEPSQHAEQIREIDTLFGRIAEADHHEALVRGGNVAGDERIGGVHRRHALEIDVGTRELRRDVMHVVVHAAQDGVGDGLGGIAALGAVAMDLLDPFEVHDGHHADQHVDVLCGIHLVGDHAAVQAFIEQQIGAFRNAFPGREFARVLPVRRGLFFAVQVVTAFAGAGLAVCP